MHEGLRIKSKNIGSTADMQAGIPHNLIRTLGESEIDHIPESNFLVELLEGANIVQLKNGLHDPGARYIYGVVSSENSSNLGPIGQDGNPVYLIPAGGLAAIVHNCWPEPYQSKDDEKVKSWVLTHQAVLDAAEQHFNTVIPFRFNVIIPAGDGTTASIEVIKWLQAEADILSQKIKKIRGRREFGIQTFYNPRVLGEVVAQSSSEIQQINIEMKSKSPGLAYMYQWKVEKLIKEELETKLDIYYQDFYQAIQRQVIEIVNMDKVRRNDDLTFMLMNISCLVERGKEEMLSAELDRINSIEGITIRFTGPWPPYSFV